MTAFLGATLFDTDGTTALRPLTDTTNKQFTDELRGDGSFTITVPAEYADEVQVGRIIKFSYGTNSDDYVFAGVIENIRISYTNEEEVIEVGGRGVRSLLESALIYTNDRSYSNKTVGFIFKELFDEAQARGALDSMSITFTNTTDSSSASFTGDQTLTIDEKLGSNLGDIANRHSELAVDVWVDPDLAVNYYIERGVDRTVSPNLLLLRVGQSLLSYNKTIEGPVKNVGLAIYSDNATPVNVEKAPSIATYGRYETFVSLSAVQDLATTNLVLDRTLATSDSPTTGATIELADNGPKPYLDFGIGDWLYVVDTTGARERYRVRAITLSEQDDGSVRIVPELGTAKAALEERLRRIIARQEAKTGGGFADAAASSLDLNGVGAVGGVGGAALEDATVLTYDSLTGLGTADAPAIDLIDPIDFTNGTGIFLGTDDSILIASVDHDNDPGTPDIYVAVGITARSGTITPVNQPIGALSTGFPLRTDNLPNGFISAASGTGYQTTLYDPTGLLGQGSDTIVGVNYAGSPTSYAGFSRNLASSFNLGTPPVTPQGYTPFLFSDGRVVLITTSNVYTRNPSTGVWTSVFSPGTGLIRNAAYDETTRYIWLYVAGTSAPAGGPFWSFSVADSAPVARGQLGTALTHNTNDTTTRMQAGNGYLVLQHNDAEPTGFRFYKKPSNNTTSFTYTAVAPSIIIPSNAIYNIKVSVVKSDAFWYLSTYTPSTPDQIQLNKYTYATNTTTSYLTGITAATQPLTYYGYTQTASGLHVFTIGRDDAGVNKVALATFNLTSTSYVYTGPTLNQYDYVGPPTEYSANVIRFSVGEQFGGIGALNGAYEIEVALT